MIGNTISLPGGGVYDIVVHTQQEFDELLASPDWFGAHSVALIGDGGNLKFTSGNSSTPGSIKIPDTVSVIDGFNVARLIIYVASDPALYYENVSAGIRSISGIKVTVTVPSGTTCTSITGIYNCDNLSNCEVEINSAASVFMNGFKLCRGLTKCNVRAMNNSPTGATIGYESCSDLYRCGGDSYGFTIAGDLHMYQSCGRIISCDGKVVNRNGTARDISIFNQCSYLDNCELRPDVRVLTSMLYVYNFCRHVNNCYIYLINNVTTADIILFRHCYHVTNCVGYLTSDTDSVGDRYGMQNCVMVANCDMAVQGNHFAKSYQGISMISNCQAYAGSPMAVGYVFGYYDCDRMSNCRAPNMRDDILFGGTNTKVDDVTVGV